MKDQTINSINTPILTNKLKARSTCASKCHTEQTKKMDTYSIRHNEHKYNITFKNAEFLNRIKVHIQ